MKYNILNDYSVLTYLQSDTNRKKRHSVF